MNYKLLPWIEEKRLSIYGLLKNPRAVGLIKQIDLPSYGSDESKKYWNSLSQNPNLTDISLFSLIKSRINDINWYVLSRNPSAFDLIKDNLDKVDWYYLCKNTSPQVVELIRHNFYKIMSDPRCYFYFLSTNPAAIDLLKEHPDKFDWKILNCNTAAIDLLEKNPDKIYWDVLSTNSAAIDLLKKNPDKIDWKAFCTNKSPDAIKLIDEKFGENIDHSLFNKLNWDYLCENPSAIWFVEKHLNRLRNLGYRFCWKSLSRNPAAIDLLKTNPGRIDWDHFSENPAIFTYDYVERAKVFEPLRNEILASSVSPIRIARGLKALGLKPEDPIPENIYKALGFPYD